MNGSVEITNCVRNGRSKMNSRKVQTKLIDPNFPRPIPTRYCTHSHILQHMRQKQNKKNRSNHPAMLFLNTNEMKAAAAAAITPKKTRTS